MDGPRGLRCYSLSKRQGDANSCKSEVGQLTVVCMEKHLPLEGCNPSRFSEPVPPIPAGYQQCLGLPGTGREGLRGVAAE